MAKKKAKAKKSENNLPEVTENPVVKDIKAAEPKAVAITITETEDDIVLDPGFNGDSAGLKEQIKKDAAKSDVLSRFLIPLFTFIVIGLIAGGLTWYYARPEVTAQTSQQDKIENAPEVKETTPAATQPQTSQPAATKTVSQPTNYTVQSGDTLSSIANANGMTSKQLADYNGITNSDSLTIGQVLKIPPK